MTEKYKGLPVNVQFSLIVADEEFKLDAEKAASNAKPAVEGWKQNPADITAYKPD